MTEFETRLRNAIDPNNAPITIIEVQDEGDTDHLWLTPPHVATLILTPGGDTLKGLRDTAMMALMLCTGVRAAELLALDVDDLQVMFGSTLALRVKSGKGSKQRLIPYGAQDWGLTITQQWLDRAGISSGAVFVGMRKGDNFYLTKEGHQVPAGISFHTLHGIVQIVMGWENYHLYRFDVGCKSFTSEPLAGEDHYSDEPIDAYLTEIGYQLFYEYDFGDHWEHVITLEKFLVRELPAPLCIAGNRACSPEDSDVYHIRWQVH
ncbi:MAG: tyrosine-type recombinase/integrase [Anaerolineae bacterium]|nr:tyrosine-type recombinase/integrase [Anaerolineae bacterium]